jgi:hypothetical protein
MSAHDTSGLISSPVPDTAGSGSNVRTTGRVSPAIGGALTGFVVGRLMGVFMIMGYLK